MLAVEVPLLKQAAIATAALGLVVGMAMPHHSHLTRHRLGLHAPKRCHAIYLTAWEHGDVTIVRDDAHPRSIVFNTREVIPDGSTWLGTETLVPLDDRTYSYQYDETVLEDIPGGTRYIKTPRHGVVTVDE